MHGVVMGLLSYLAVSHTYPEPSKDEHELEKQRWWYKGRAKFLNREGRELCNHVWAYLSFIQHESPKIVCNQKVAFSGN